MFSLEGFHVFPLKTIKRFPHAAFDIKPKWPATSKQCHLFLFEWQRTVPRKPLLSWLLRNPLGQPPVAQSRRTGEILPRLTREGHLAICIISGRAVPRKPLCFKSKQVLMRTHGRRATTFAPAHCITNKSRFRKWLHHPNLRSEERRPLFPEHSRIRVLRAKDLDTTQFQNQLIMVCTKYDQWQGGTYQTTVFQEQTGAHAYAR